MQYLGWSVFTSVLTPARSGSAGHDCMFCVAEEPHEQPLGTAESGSEAGVGCAGSCLCRRVCCVFDRESVDFALSLRASRRGTRFFVELSNNNERNSLVH